MLHLDQHRDLDITLLSFSMTFRPLFCGHIPVKANFGCSYMYFIWAKTVTLASFP